MAAGATVVSPGVCWLTVALVAAIMGCMRLLAGRLQTLDNFYVTTMEQQAVSAFDLH